MSWQVSIGKLRELKLPGMIDALRQSVDAGTVNSLTPAELLTLLTDRAWEHLQNPKAERLCRNANFRYSASVQSVETTADRNLDRAPWNRLAGCEWIAKGQNLLITGPTGAGKSYLASEMGQQAWRQDYTTLRHNCTKFWSGTRIARSHIDGLWDWSEDRRARGLLAEGIPGARRIEIDGRHVAPLEDPAGFAALCGRL